MSARAVKLPLYIAPNILGQAKIMGKLSGEIPKIRYRALICINTSIKWSKLLGLDSPAALPLRSDDLSLCLAGCTAHSGVDGSELFERGSHPNDVRSISTESRGMSVDKEIDERAALERKAGFFGDNLTQIK
jgi:hypothetical protein